MPPFLTSAAIDVTTEDLQAAVDAYLLANPLDLTTHLAAADPHTGYQLESQKGNANGYASLNGSGVIPDNQIGSTIARDSEIVTQISDHVFAEDPHADRATAAFELASHVADTIDIHGIANTSLLATEAEVASLIAAHNADTTDVHGIPNVSTLVTTSSTLVWPQRLWVTTNQTEPVGAVEGDFWIAPA
jgi:hypothetical protein